MDKPSLTLSERTVDLVTEYNAGIEGVRPIIAARANDAKPVTHLGCGLGIASIVFAVIPFFGPISAVAAGIGALSISKKAGNSNGWVVTGIVLGCICLSGYFMHS